MTQPDDYKKVLTDLIQKQMVVLGPDIALDKVTGVEGLFVDKDGVVTKITADPQLVLKAVITEYSALSEPVTKMVLQGLLNKYPEISDFKKFAS